jgi:hypothetical protein
MSEFALPGDDRATLSPADEWDALVSEGHCVQCRGRLRGLTEDERAIADDWYANPIGICDVDNAVIGTYQNGRPFISWPPEGEAPLESSWRTRLAR